MASNAKVVNKPLPPLDFTEENELYEAKNEKTKIAFPSCPHTEIKVVDGWLKCSCGAGWTGPGMHQLYDLLIAKKPINNG